LDQIPKKLGGTQVTSILNFLLLGFFTVHFSQAQDSLGRANLGTINPVGGIKQLFLFGKGGLKEGFSNPSLRIIRGRGSTSP